MARHKHAEIIHAWADGAEIQYLRLDGVWEDISFPPFSESNEYRIKPKIVRRGGWVNIYRTYTPETPEMLCCIHPTEKVAKTFASDGLVATVKVEWSEEE